MSFSFFTWLHDEVMALRAAVARLESHTGSPESKPAPKPVDAVPPAVEPAKPAPVAEPPVVAPVAPPPQVISDPVIAPPPAGPAFDPHKTVLDLRDAGGLFEPVFGTTTYTITGPLKVQLVIDGTEVLTEKASMSIDGKPELFAGVNPTADVIGPGPHSVVVQSNVVTGRTRLQVQPVA